MKQKHKPVKTNAQRKSFICFEIDEHETYGKWIEK